MQKSETILNEDIAKEIRRAWHFMPYKITYDGSSINRYTSEIDYECLACNAKIHTTFARLEEMWQNHKYYCPYCCSSYNPVYEEKLPNELVEHDEKYIPDLDAEYAIMSGIEEHLKCKPYGFKNINKGRSVRLQHKACSTIFTATPTMLYKQFTIPDRYTGEPFTTPYCPKCNQILEHEGINYGGTRFIERLHNWFTDLGKELPYEFSEDDIYRFKDYDLELIVTCVYCGHKFAATPNSLFSETGESLCPVCHGRPRPEDSGEGAIDDLNVENAERKLEEEQNQLQQQEETVMESEDTVTEDADTNTQNEPETFVDSIDKPISSDEVFEDTISEETVDATDEENLNEIPESAEDHMEFTETELQEESTVKDSENEITVDEEPESETVEEDLLAKYSSSDDDYGSSIEDSVQVEQEELPVKEEKSDVIEDTTSVEEPIVEKEETHPINDLSLEDVMNYDEPTDSELARSEEETNDQIENIVDSITDDGSLDVTPEIETSVEEMLNDFSFLGDDLAYEIVVTNTNKVLDMVDEIEVIVDTGGIPFSPRVKSDDGKSYLDCPRVVTDLVYTKAGDWYGEPLPHNIEERIAKELYGDIVYKIWSAKISKEQPDLKDNELEVAIFNKLHETVTEGFDKVKELVSDYVKENWTEEDGELTDKSLEKKVKKSLGGIIGGGFDPIYLIAQRLVKHSNDDGYLVGSRGSVGSSFVATMMGITEVNPLPAHYRCTKCKHSIFKDDKGNELGATYSSGFDLPDMKCPNCGEPMYKDGQDMPFATFLGFNADKVPDIDLNFSDLNQASAHEYTKVLFGVDNVYRAGTIGTVAEKTAYGFVKGYFEDKGITNKRSCEIERLAIGCTGVKRTTGQHPGGIVVVPDYMEVSDFTPFQFPADDVTSAWRTTHFDYHAIDQDLLKLDILGHSDPTQLRLIQDLTGTDVSKVPLDDKETMSIFTSTKALGVTEEEIMCKTGTLGIPEFGTPFTIGMVEDTKPTTFAELIKISGLSHGTDVWLGNAQDLIKNNVVPFKEVIGCRDDIMVYLMYHGVEPIKAFKIMEFVRKGKASKDPETWKGHVETMEKAGIEKWFIDSCAKIKYMFPKAHAAAYVISAFRIAWYKVHMPAYYYASWFSTKATDFNIEAMINGYSSIKEKLVEINEKGFDATNKEAGVAECLKLALEATARGIKIANVDLYKSKALTFGVLDDKTIIPSFSSIDGLGDVVAKNIEVEASKHPFISIEDFQNRCKVSTTLVDKMKSMGIFNDMPETSQLSLF